MSLCAQHHHNKSSYRIRKNIAKNLYEKKNLNWIRNKWKQQYFDRLQLFALKLLLNVHLPAGEKLFQQTYNVEPNIKQANVISEIKELLIISWKE